MLKIERISVQQFVEIASEWESMNENNKNGNLFLSWHWNYTWWKTFNKNRSIYILTFRNNQELVGILPMYRQKKRHWTGMRFTVLSFMGTENTSSEHLSFLYRSGFERAVVREFINFLERNKDQWDIVQIRDFADDTVIVGMLQAESKNRGFTLLFDRTEICPYLTLPQSNDIFYANLSSNMRYNIRRRKRQLKKLGFEMHVKDKFDRNNSAFTEMVRLHNARWQMDSLPGNFRSQAIQTFHKELLVSKIEQCKPLLFFLSNNEMNIAAIYAFQCRDKLLYYQGGYDPAYSKYSPGLTLTALVIEYAISKGLKEYDFLRGDEEYKWKWTNDYRMTISFSIFQQKLSSGIRVVLDNLRMEIVRSLKGKRNSRKLK